MKFDCVSCWIGLVSFIWISCSTVKMSGFCFSTHPKSTTNASDATDGNRFSTPRGQSISLKLIYYGLATSVHVLHQVVVGSFALTGSNRFYYWEW